MTMSLEAKRQQHDWRMGNMAMLCGDSAYGTLRR